jgi:hypothetical protein
MSEKISWSFKAQVTGGPSVAAADTLEVDAYDKIEAKVTVGGTTKVAVQPGPTGVKFLLIKASDYKNLEYEVTDGASGVKLDAAQLFNGEGAVGLLDASPTELTFTHNSVTTDDTTVEILVGRTATS